MYQTAKIIEICTVSASLRGISGLLLHCCKNKTCCYKGPVMVQNRLKPPKKHPKQGVPVKNLTPTVKNLINPYK